MSYVESSPEIALLLKLEELSIHVSTASMKKCPFIDRSHATQKISAKNLIEYLALRSLDIRPLQDRLHTLGLSSLNSSESHILRQLQAVMQLLGKQINEKELSACNYHVAKNLLSRRSMQLFGTKTESNIPYLMVTFDTSFATDRTLVKNLLLQGMNIARINCAHDDLDTWERMIKTIRSASRKTGVACKIYMDLAGPKMRTVILSKGNSEKKRNKSGNLSKVKISEGQNLIFAEKNTTFNPAEVVIGCEEANIVQQLNIGDRVLFDDGVIETTVIAKTEDIAILKVVRISSRKSKIKAQKGINFPDSKLQVSSLTDYDRDVLPFVCRNTDLIGCSFIRNTTDVKNIFQAISAYSPQPHVILKIETVEAVENLPAILLEAMQEELFGVMIARGDLAVEIGFERMSEIQEEILWISEAAHTPVIWATQVLDTLNKSGIATRAEVTDAFYAALSECVMINKGMHTLKVIESLKDILRRSGGHHLKKRHTSRAMHIASRFFDEHTGDA